MVETSSDWSAVAVVLENKDIVVADAGDGVITGRKGVRHADIRFVVKLRKEDSEGAERRGQTTAQFICWWLGKPVRLRLCSHAMTGLR